MEFVIAGFVTGLAVLIALHQFFDRRAEAQDAEYLRDRLLEAADDLRGEQRAHQFWLARAGEASSQVVGLMNEVAEYDEALGVTLDDLEDSEEELQELEDESDGFEAIARDAFRQAGIANDLAERTIAWGARVLDVLERVEEERL